MTISADLFLAILAMDTYNRENWIQVKVEGTQIGYASFATGSSGLFDGMADATHFHAAAYTIHTGGLDGLAVGDTVISYRGTDGSRSTRTCSARCCG